MCKSTAVGSPSRVQHAQYMPVMGSDGLFFLRHLLPAETLKSRHSCQRAWRRQIKLESKRYALLATQTRQGTTQPPGQHSVPGRRLQRRPGAHARTGCAAQVHAARSAARSQTAPRQGRGLPHPGRSPQRCHRAWLAAAAPHPARRSHAQRHAQPQQHSAPRTTAAVASRLPRSVSAQRTCRPECRQPCTAARSSATLLSSSAPPGAAPSRPPRRLLALATCSPQACAGKPVSRLGPSLQAEAGAAGWAAHERRQSAAGVAGHLTAERDPERLLAAQRGRRKQGRARGRQALRPVLPQLAREAPAQRRDALCQRAEPPAQLLATRRVCLRCCLLGPQTCCCPRRVPLEPVAAGAGRHAGTRRPGAADLGDVQRGRKGGQQQDVAGLRQRAGRERGRSPAAPAAQAARRHARQPRERVHRACPRDTRRRARALCSTITTSQLRAWKHPVPGQGTTPRIQLHTETC
jgi:hypothetical protein